MTRIAAVALTALLVAGCSMLGEQAASRPQGQWGNTEIVGEFSEHEITAEAAAEPSAKYITPGIVGVVGALVAKDPLMSVVAYGATMVGLAAVEQGKAGHYGTQTIRVPVIPGQPSCTIRRPDSTTIILVGRATSTALGDGLPDGLSADDAALWRRMMGAATAAATPQPPTIGPK